MLLLFVLSNQHFVTHFKFNFVLFGTEDDIRTVETFILFEKEKKSKNELRRP